VGAGCTSPCPSERRHAQSVQRFLQIVQVGQIELAVFDALERGRRGRGDRTNLQAAITPDVRSGGNRHGRRATIPRPRALASSRPCALASSRSRVLALPRPRALASLRSRCTRNASRNVHSESGANRHARAACVSSPGTPSARARQGGARRERAQQARSRCMRVVSQNALSESEVGRGEAGAGAGPAGTLALHAYRLPERPQRERGGAGQGRARRGEAGAGQGRAGRGGAEPEHDHREARPAANAERSSPRR
jgi:hypothetical protein